MLDSTVVCRRALGCEWGGIKTGRRGAHAARSAHRGTAGASAALYVPYADFFQYQAGAGRLAGRA